MGARLSLCHCTGLVMLDGVNITLNSDSKHKFFIFFFAFGNVCKFNRFSHFTLLIVFKILCRR